MSPHVNIRRRATTHGRSYQVRYRPGGRGLWRYAGSFPTPELARARALAVHGWLAAGLDPRAEVRRLANARPATVMAIAADLRAAISGRSALKRHDQVVARLGALAGADPAAVNGRDVQAWITANAVAGDGRPALGPSSLRQYLGELRRIFDHAEISPNPAAWSGLRVPRDEDGESEHVVDPPSLAEFRALRRTIVRRYRHPLAILEATGLRVGELMALRWADVDLTGERIRVGRTKRGTRGIRFVPLTRVGASVIASQAAPEDRIAARTVFGGLSDQGLRLAMGRAAKHAGLRHFHPHDLRHRDISRLHAAGVPGALIREIVGHSKLSTTHDIYTHALIGEPPWRLAELRAAVGRMTGLGEPSPSRGALVVPRASDSGAGHAP